MIRPVADTPISSDNVPQPPLRNLAVKPEQFAGVRDDRFHYLLRALKLFSAGLQSGGPVIDGSEHRRSVGQGRQWRFQRRRERQRYFL